MFCHKCGIQLLDDSAFCHKCGAKSIEDDIKQAGVVTTRSFEQSIVEEELTQQRPVASVQTVSIESIESSQHQTEMVSSQTTITQVDLQMLSQTTVNKPMDLLEEAIPITSEIPDIQNAGPNGKKPKKLIISLAGAFIGIIIMIAVIVIASWGDNIEVNVVTLVRNHKPFESRAGISATIDEVTSRLIDLPSWEASYPNVNINGRLKGSGERIHISYEVVVSNGSSFTYLDTIALDGVAIDDTMGYLLSLFKAYDLGFDTYDDYLAELRYVQAEDVTPEPSVTQEPVDYTSYNGYWYLDDELDGMLMLQINDRFVIGTFSGEVARYRLSGFSFEGMLDSNGIIESDFIDDWGASGYMVLSLEDGLVFVYIDYYEVSDYFYHLGDQVYTRENRFSRDEDELATMHELHTGDVLYKGAPVSWLFDRQDEEGYYDSFGDLLSQGFWDDSKHYLEYNDIILIIDSYMYIVFGAFIKADVCEVGGVAETLEQSQETLTSIFGIPDYEYVFDGIRYMEYQWSDYVFELMTDLNQGGIAKTIGVYNKDWYDYW